MRGNESRQRPRDRHGRRVGSHRPRSESLHAFLISTSSSPRSPRYHHALPAQALGESRRRCPCCILAFCPHSRCPHYAIGPSNNNDNSALNNSPFCPYSSSCFQCSLFFHASHICQHPEQRHVFPLLLLLPLPIRQHLRL